MDVTKLDYYCIIIVINSKSNMKNIIGIILILSAAGIFGVRIVKIIRLKQNVTGYLKRAADASTINLANEELTRAISYLESTNLTDGYTSIFWKTPAEDIGFWYKNLKASQLELQNLNSDSALEKTNVLIKLRETILDNAENERVTVPQGLEIFPHNKLWAFFLIFAMFGGFYGFVLLSIKDQKKPKSYSEMYP